MTTVQHTTILRCILPALLAILTSCGSNRRPIEIHAGNWPDGTRLTVMTADGATDRTAVYGGRARLDSPSGIFRLSAAHPEMLTAFTDTITVVDDPGTIPLPSPVARRRFGLWRLGMGFDHPAADSLTRALCEASPLSFTTLTLDRSLNRLVTVAHEAAVECLLSGENRPLTGLVEGAEQYGFDGIVANLDSIMGDDDPENSYEMLREGTRECGITLTVTAAIRSTDGTERLDGIAAWYTGLPAGEQPDEFRLAFRGDADVSVVTAERIEETASYLAERGIPLSVMSADLEPASVKYHVLDDGSLEPAEMQPGEIDFLFAIVSGTPGVRLRDGSLRIGSRGDLYVVEDTESMVMKIARLRSGPLSASAGVHLTCGRYGVIFGPDDMARIAGAVTAPETVAIP